MTSEVRQARKRVELAEKKLETNKKALKYLEGIGTGKPPRPPRNVKVPNASQFTHGIIKSHVQNRVNALKKQVNLERQIVEALERVNNLKNQVNQARKEIINLSK
jgi:hypothetical protein